MSDKALSSTSYKTLVQALKQEIQSVSTGVKLQKNTGIKLQVPA